MAECVYVFTGYPTVVVQTESVYGNLWGQRVMSVELKWSIPCEEKSSLGFEGFDW